MTQITVSLPDDLLARIDEEAQRCGASRDDVIERAARREVTRLAEFDAALERARELFADEPPYDFAAMIRADRDTRDQRHS